MPQLNCNPEYLLHCQKVQSLMQVKGVQMTIVTTPVNVYYLLGRIINGYVVLLPTGKPWIFVRRPLGIEGEQVCYVRKPELIPDILSERAAVSPSDITHLAIEVDALSYNECIRLAQLYPSADTAISADQLLRQARAVKTEAEQQQMRACGKVHEQVYAQVPHLYRQGMTDHEFAIELEYYARQQGHIGVFRTFGTQMEAFMGSSILIGDNADVPSPYDFALGGAGMNPALPVGDAGCILQSGETMMVDGGGCYGAYITDMTRVYAYDEVSELAQKAHQCSCEIHDYFRQVAKPGVGCADIYLHALQMVAKAGLKDYFMGHTQQAAFLGHGVGLQINELPVFYARSKDVLEVGNVVAIEPKFVIPGTGAVGIENTYIITAEGLECITNLPEEIVPLFK